MAKKMNPFVADFEGLNKSADDKVLAMLMQAEKSGGDTSSQPAVVKTKKQSAPKVVKKTASEKPKVEPVKNEKKKLAKPKASVEWGKPVALFNTRIPEKMSELLDDLVYQRKKEGRPCTKQAIAIDAIEAYLRQQKIIHS